MEEMWTTAQRSFRHGRSGYGHSRAYASRPWLPAGESCARSLHKSRPRHRRLRAHGQHFRPAGGLLVGSPLAAECTALDRLKGTGDGAINRGDNLRNVVLDYWPVVR